MNVGNQLGSRPSIKLFPQYNAGDTMRALLADCGGLGEGLGDQTKPPQPAAVHLDATQPSRPNATVNPNQQQAYNVIKFQPSATHETGGKQPVSKDAKKNDDNRMSAVEAQRNLWEGARQGDTQLVKAALAAGADPVAANPTDGWLALHYAASGNRRLTCQLLLSLPSAAQQCNWKSLVGETPIRLCRNKSLQNMLREASEC